MKHIKRWLIGLATLASVSPVMAQTPIMGEFGCTLVTPRGVAVSGSRVIVADPGGNRIVARDTTGGPCQVVAGTGVSGFSGDGGPATAAKLSGPMDVAALPDGSLAISDGYNGRLRIVDAAGIIRTLATAPNGSFPWGLNANPDGSFLWAGFNASQIYRVTSAGAVAAIAGKPWSSGFGGDGGPATAATLFNATDANLDPATGDIIVADYNSQRLRRINAAGIISTIAGSGYAITSGDGGPVAAAQFSQPAATVISADGALYVAQLPQSGPGFIRRIKGGTITSLAPNLPAPVGGIAAGATSLYASAGPMVYAVPYPGFVPPTLPPTLVPTAIPTPKPTNTPTAVAQCVVHMSDCAAGVTVLP